MISDSPSDFLSLLWRATWQASVLFGVVWLLVRLTRPWVTPQYRAILWMIPLCRMLIVVVPSSSFSLYYATSRFESRVETQSAEIVSNTVLDGGPLNFTVETLPMASNRELAPTRTDPPVSAETPSSMKTPRHVWDFSSLVLIVWLAGCGIALIYWVQAYVRLQLVTKRSKPINTIRQLACLDAIAAHSRFRASIRVLVTDSTLGPATAGFFRPVIFLPVRLVESLSSDQLRAIVRHEAVHVRRWDSLVFFICRLVTVLHWFNPLAHWNVRLIRREAELAVDAAAIRGLDDESRRSYGELLLKLAQHPENNMGLVQMASRRSNLRTRIEAIAKPQRNSWMQSAFAAGLIGALCLVGLSDVAKTQSQPVQPAVAEVESNAYFIVGRVTEEGTGKPVTDATLGFLVESEQNPEKRAPQCQTDQDGRYRIEVPMGEVKLWFPWLKPGYWLPHHKAMVSVTTTPQQPEATLDIVAKRGPIWQIQAVGDLGDYPILSSKEESDPAKRAALLKGENVRWEKSPATAFSKPDAAGRGALTQVGTSGGLVVGIVNVQAEIVAEPGFDNTNVASATQVEGFETTELIDRDGKKAIVTVADVSLSDGVPLLTFKLKSTTPIANQKLKGRMVDADGVPVAAARIGVALGIKDQGSATRPHSTQTDDEGYFNLEVPVSGSYKGELQELQFAVIVNKDGFAGIDSPFIGTREGFPEIDFGTLEFSAGYSIPVIVVDKNGRKLPGAVLEPSGDYALRRQATRTDVRGEAVLNNLPSGLVGVSARYGNQHASSRLYVSDDVTENTPVTIRLSELPEANATAEAQRSQSIPVGSEAPEWAMRSWSDGEQRRLSDFRGKVVVLDFWGMWCSPCINAIPAMQSLAEKYEPEGVVFIGVHTADGDMSQILKFQKATEWTMPTGIDVGSSVTDGETCKAYGIHAYPGVVIIDADGRIAFHSGIQPGDREMFMKEMGQIANANGIRWPLDENAPEDELKQAANKLLEIQISREIDRALNK